MPNLKSKTLRKKLNLIGLQELEAKVRKAKSAKKIFILTLRYEAIRQGLLNRNWLEKVSAEQLNHVTFTPGSERLKIALLLKNSSFNFIWQSRNRPIKSFDNNKPFINSIWRERQLDFTTKDGITSLANSFHWHYIEGVTELNYQRTHIVNDKASKDEFFEDFRRTIFTSFILFLNNYDIRQFFSKTGEIEKDCIDFALQKVELLLKLESHDDLDTSSLFDVCAKFPKNQKLTMGKIKSIANGKKKFHFKFEELSIFKDYEEKIKISANKILTNWPHLRYDGYKNLWIFKPLNSSSGNGITVLNNEDKIQSFMLNSKSTTYAIQKYIERPMIIHDRKFDIRIYILTFIHDNHVNIWLYKDCYIKFATHPFTCDNFNKSIHVTNYAVQKFFMNDKNIVPGARENMWTLSQFIDYFQVIDNPRLWEAKMYPSIKKNLLAVILPSLEGTELEDNHFELNGADFMIGFDHEPILIEVNSVPALFFSKVVMELITTKLLDDILKVVVDRTSDPQAYVGDFELIYTQEIYQTKNVVDLTVEGKKIERKIDRKKFKESKKKNEEIPLIEKKIEFVTANGTKFTYIKEKA